MGLLRPIGSGAAAVAGSPAGDDSSAGRAAASSRGLIAALVLAIAATAGSCSDRAGERPADWDGPVAVVEEPEHDFGPLFAHETRRHVYVIENRGTRDLELGAMQVDCGCTTPALDRRRVPPGESARLTLDFTPPMLGRIEKRIRLETDDVHADPLTFTVKAEGFGRLRVEPPVLRFSGDVPAEGLVTELVLQAPPERELDDVVFATTNPWLRITPLLDDARTDGRTRRFEVRLAPPPGEVALRETVPFTFRFSGDERRLPPTVPLEVIARVRPTAQVIPPVLVLGDGAAGGAACELRGLAADARPEDVPDGLELVAAGPGRWEVSRRDGGAPTARTFARLTFRDGEGRAADLRVELRSDVP